MSARRHPRLQAARVWVLACAMGLAGCVSSLREPPSLPDMAGTGSDVDVDCERKAADAERAYAAWTLEQVRAALSLWLEVAAADENDVEGLIGASRAAVWLASRESSAQSREAAAVRAVNSAQHCVQRAPDSPECSYWLALALGVQARERRTTAIDALPRIVSLLQSAASERPEIEHAGPDRVLALVLLRAPGWPTGPGDIDLGLQHARRAAELRPDYPPNQLCLGEALAAVEEIEESRSAYGRAVALSLRWIAAGDPEASEWLEEAEKGPRRH